MPTLGGDHGHARRAPAAAYAAASGNKSTSILIILLGLLILKNVLFTDYRGEMISSLTRAGKSATEIERYVPHTPEEIRQIRQGKKVDDQRLRQDVSYLLSEVHNLKQVLAKHGINATATSVESNHTKSNPNAIHRIQGEDAKAREQVES